MTYKDIRNASIIVEFFDDPTYNRNNNESEIIDFRFELGYDEQESEEIWDVLRYQDKFKSFADENDNAVDYKDEKALYDEVLKYAKEIATFILKVNGYEEAYNILVYVNAYDTGEEYKANIIESI